MASSPVAIPACSGMWAIATVDESYSCYLKPDPIGQIPVNEMFGLIAFNAKYTILGR